MNFLIGFILIAGGIAIMKFRYVIYGVTGEWGWAAQYLGGNGTVTAIVLMGMIMVGAGVSYPFGVLDKGSMKSPQIQQVQQVQPKK